MPRVSLVLFLLCAALRAQTGQIVGTVKDATGAAVPGAEVKATGTVTGTTFTATTGPDGAYRLPALPAGQYTVEISKEGFQEYQTGFALAANSTATVDASLQPSRAPSLADLGFSPAQQRGSAEEQARLDRRSHMLRTHQRLGLITLAPLIATLATSSGAKPRRGTVSGRELHAGLGAATAGMYFTSASFATFAPKIQGTHTRGPIRVHKILAWIHGPGMILTPILGAMAFSQINAHQKVHGIAQAHSAVAWATTLSYGAAMLSVSIKF